MAISLKTHKMLWGRSGGICAFPNCEQLLVVDDGSGFDPTIIGEEAHIVSKQNNGPRGDSLLPIEERDEYHNLVLLCRIHHKIIDSNIDEYTVDALKQIKKNHEELVIKTSAIDFVKQEEDEVYSGYIDKIMYLANVESWYEWTSRLLGYSSELSIDNYKSLTEIHKYINSRVWFKRHLDLKNSILNFNNILSNLIYAFDLHSIPMNKMYVTERFYKSPYLSVEVENSKLKLYNYHIFLIADLTLELTRAMNYIFEKVRKSLFKSFRIQEGNLLVDIRRDRNSGFSHDTVLYNEEEKSDFPYLE